MSNHILSRYILREHAGPFSFSLTVITMIFLLDLLFRSLNRILSKGLDWTVVLEFLGLNLAWIVATAVPMAVLTATLMTFGRLAADNEIAAMQACGINLWRQVLPVFLAAALLAVGLIWFNDNILPDCNLRVRTLAADIVRRKPTVQIEPGIWYNEIPKYGLLAQTLEDSAGFTKARHLLIDDNSRAEVRRTISARAGLIQANTVEGAFLLTLFDGEIQELNLMNGEEFRRLTFSKHIMAIGAKKSAIPESESPTRTDREKSTKQMWEEVGAVHAQIALLREQLQQLEKQPSLARWREEKIATIFQFEADVQALLVEIHKKYAIPVACLVFVVIGAPLGTLARRGGIATGAGLSLGFFLFYWAGLIGGEALADRRILSPVFAMWFANLVTGGLGVFVFGYVATGKLLPSSFALIVLMGAIFSKEFWQRKSVKPSPRKKTSSFDFKLLDDELAEFSKERGLAKSDEARATGDFKLLEHELAEFSKEHGLTKSDEAGETSEFKLAEPEPVKFSQERGLTKLDEAVETAVEYEVLTFDVVEPEFINQLQAGATIRLLAPPVPRSGLETMRETLQEFVAQARLALVVLGDRNGIVMVSCSNPHSRDVLRVDFNKLAALAAAQMSMVQIFGKALDEEGEFTCIFQEGERNNLFIYQINQEYILTVLAERKALVGLVRIYASEAVKGLKNILEGI